jgi:hypothetical protein
MAAPVDERGEEWRDVEVCAEGIDQGDEKAVLSTGSRCGVLR